MRIVNEIHKSSENIDKFNFWIQNFLENDTLIVIWIKPIHTVGMIGFIKKNIGAVNYNRILWNAMKILKMKF